MADRYRTAFYVIGLGLPPNVLHALTVQSEDSYIRHIARQTGLALGSYPTETYRTNEHIYFRVDIGSGVWCQFVYIHGRGGYQASYIRIWDRELLKSHVFRPGDGIDWLQMALNQLMLYINNCKDIHETFKKCVKNLESIW